MTGSIGPLSAFTAVGIELEFMIVDALTLAVRPIADRILLQDGRPVNELAQGELAWSNELVLHVVEIKNPRPAPTLTGLPHAFQQQVGAIEQRLAPLGARLMPGGMHPWMNPRRETHLWPHDSHAIYAAYDRIFDCRSHGWANLQSMHINLPFAGDDEFARLHAAIRAALPILPALAASSPVAGGHATGWVDYRMHMYAHNADGFPQIPGVVVPETVTSRDEYQARILQPMYRAIAPHDPEHVLQHEWLNSRGAIARFDRSAIEIRVIDTQECVQANLAVAWATVALVRMLYESGTLAAQQELPSDALAAILTACNREGEKACIDYTPYLRLLGCKEDRISAGHLWEHLLARMRDEDIQSWRQPLQAIVEHGPLARRILSAIGSDGDRAKVEAVYRALCDCLRENRMFIGLA